MSLPFPTIKFEMLYPGPITNLNSYKRGTCRMAVRQAFKDL